LRTARAALLWAREAREAEQDRCAPWNDWSRARSAKSFFLCHVDGRLQALRHHQHASAVEGHRSRSKDPVDMTDIHIIRMQTELWNRAARDGAFQVDGQGRVGGRDCWQQLAVGGHNMETGCSLGRAAHRSVHRLLSAGYFQQSTRVHFQYSLKTGWPGAQKRQAASQGGRQGLGDEQAPYRPDGTLWCPSPSGKRIGPV